MGLAVAVRGVIVGFLSAGRPLPPLDIRTIPIKKAPPSFFFGAKGGGGFLSGSKSQKISPAALLGNTCIFGSTSYLPAAGGKFWTF